MKLGDICEIKKRRDNINSKSYDCNENDKRTVYIISTKAISKTGDISFNEGDIDKDLPYFVVNKRLIEPGDILLTCGNSNLKVGIFKESYPKSIYDNNLCVIRIKNKNYSPVILSYILKFKRDEIICRDKNGKTYIKNSTLMNLDLPEFDEISMMKTEMTLLALEKKYIEAKNTALTKCKCYRDNMYKCLFK